MSDRKYSLELSQEAYDDLINIQNYTYATHGEHQWEKYEVLLDKAMMAISNNPFAGHGREDLPEVYSAWNVGEHVMIFRTEESIIYIVRVLHGKMDFKLQF